MSKTPQPASAPGPSTSDGHPSDQTASDPAHEAERTPATAPAVPPTGDDAARAQKLRRAKAALDFGDPLYGRSSDDSDGGWGERPVPRTNSAADLARFLDEKPPHHI